MLASAGSHNALYNLFWCHLQNVSTSSETRGRFVRIVLLSLQWHHNGLDSVSTHQPHDCLLKRLFSPRSKKTSKLRVTGLCVGNSPETGDFPAQRASNAENVSIWWRHHASLMSSLCRVRNIMMYALSRRQLLRNSGNKHKKCTLSWSHL